MWDRSGALKLCPIPFTELLHLVPALDGGFRRVSGGAATVDIVGDFLPVGGAEVAAAEGVPLVAVGVDEGGGFLGRPARRREAAGGGDGGWH